MYDFKLQQLIWYRNSYRVQLLCLSIHNWANCVVLQLSQKIFASLVKKSALKISKISYFKIWHWPKLVKKTANIYSMIFIFVFCKAMYLAHSRHFKANISAYKLKKKLGRALHTVCFKNSLHYFCCFLEDENCFGSHWMA